jgi:hypothetical protein
VVARETVYPTPASRDRERQEGTQVSVANRSTSATVLARRHSTLTLPRISGLSKSAIDTVWVPACAPLLHLHAGLHAEELEHRGRLAPAIQLAVRLRTIRGVHHRRPFALRCGTWR